MNPEDFVEIGYISKAHGLTGELKIVFDVHDMEEYADLPVLYLGKEGENIQPYIVEYLSMQTTNQFLVAFTSIKDRISAENLHGYTIYFPKEELPPLEEGHFYYYQVIGFKVNDKEKGLLGEITGFIDGNVQDVMVMDHQGYEVLIPVVDHIVGLADFDKKRVEVDLPEGLLELYMGLDDEEDDEA